MRVKEICSQHYSMKAYSIYHNQVWCKICISVFAALYLFSWLVMILSFTCEGRTGEQSNTGKLRVPEKPHAADCEPAKGHRACQQRRSDSVVKGMHTLAKARIHIIHGTWISGMFLNPVYFSVFHIQPPDDPSATQCGTWNNSIRVMGKGGF